MRGFEHVDPLLVSGGAETVRSGLTDVVYLLRFLADQPAGSEWLREADPHADGETVVQSSIAERCGRKGVGLL